LNAAKIKILLLWLLIVTSLGNASATTPGATENRVWQKSLATVETRQVEPLQTLGRHQENEGAGYDFASDSLLAAKTTADGSIKFKRWKRGESIDKPLLDGSPPTWDTVQSRYWKNRYEAAKSSGEFTPPQLAEIRKGNAPTDYNPRTGQWDRRELHHVDPQRNTIDNSPINLRELTPDWHAEVDPFRHVPGIQPVRGIR